MLGKRFVVGLAIGVSVVMFSGCATSTPKGIYIGKINVAENQRYVRTLISKQAPNMTKIMLEIDENSGGFHHLAYVKDLWKSKIYEIAYYAKKKGYESVYFELNLNDKIANKKMISSANDLLETLPKLYKYPFVANAELYRKKPFGKFTIDTDELLKVFAPYKDNRIIKRAEFFNDRNMKCKVKSYQCIWRKQIGFY